MKYPIKTSIALLLTTCIAHSVVQAEDNPTVVTVNGTALTQTDYDEYLTAREKRDSSHQLPSDKDTIIDELIRREVVLQDAKKQGLDKDPDFIKKIEKARQNLLMEFAVKNNLKLNPISDEQVKTEYDSRIKEITLPLQYNAKHILVTTEAVAQELIEKLDKGADFSVLAKEYSADKKSGAKGGDLGWFDVQQMVPEFGAAIKTMDKNAHSKKPVRTQFGWHIILMQDSRTASAPSLDSVKDKLKENLKGMQMMSYIDELLKQAKVEK